MGLQPRQQVAAVLPHRFGHHQRGFRMNALEYVHAHALAVNESVLELRIVGMRAPHCDALGAKGRSQHLFQPRLRRPADLIRRLAQIAVRNQNYHILSTGLGSYHLRNCISCHFVILTLLWSAILSRFGRFPSFNYLRRSTFTPMRSSLSSANSWAEMHKQPKPQVRLPRNRPLMRCNGRASRGLSIAFHI